MRSLNPMIFTFRSTQKVESKSVTTAKDELYRHVGRRSRRLGFGTQTSCGSTLASYRRLRDWMKTIVSRVNFHKRNRKLFSLFPLTSNLSSVSTNIQWNNGESQTICTVASWLTETQFPQKQQQQQTKPKKKKTVNERVTCNQALFSFRLVNHSCRNAVSAWENYYNFFNSFFLIWLASVWSAGRLKWSTETGIQFLLAEWLRD